MKALLVIDMQNEFLDDVYNRSIVVRNVKKLIESFRKKKHLIVFAQEYHTSNNDKEFKRWGRHCFVGTDGVRIIDELRDYKYVLIRKKRYSAFFHTRLNSLLKSHKIKDLYITGLFTDFCVIATSLSAYFNDYNVFVVSDATSTSDPKAQKQSLRMIKKQSANLVKTSQLL